MLPYIKNISRVWENTRQFSFLPTELDIIDIRQHYVRILFIFQCFICCISNTDKHELGSIWERISCCNDVINHVDSVIKRDVYPQKMHSCSKNIRGKSSFFVLKLSVVCKKNYIGDIAWIFV